MFCETVGLSLVYSGPSSSAPTHQEMQALQSLNTPRALPATRRPLTGRGLCRQGPLCLVALLLVV